MADHIQKEYESIKETVDKTGTDFAAFKRSVWIQTTLQHDATVQSTTEALEELQELLEFISESDQKLLESPVGSSRCLMPGTFPAEDMGEKIGSVIHSFNTASGTADAALELVLKCNEEVCEFQHSRIFRLRQTIKEFLDKIDSHSKENDRKTEANQTKTRDVKSKIESNSNQQSSTAENIDGHQAKAAGWGVGGGVAATAIGILFPPAGIAIGAIATFKTIDHAIDADNLKDVLKSLRSQKDNLDKEAKRLGEESARLKTIQGEASRLKSSGRGLENDTDSLIDEAKAVREEVEEFKEGATTFIRGLSEFRTQAVDPLQYCRTRKAVLRVLDEAMASRAAIAWKSEMRPLLEGIDAQVASIHKNDIELKKYEGKEALKNNRFHLLHC
ncbi:hypothetical protein K432DRAFT_470744 [Lepidopterella palustris CBS 459.81]|uniref:Uncharacterized protein n=1 Tax=Lepidopterella palustris CBS 459.81 TaxID=1314670 RepID=A0A8E2DYS0_9PEZI|nr:hypothetical protein K432DRAFT_470744 [Lepidopterella palustris CBS 459.81]